MSTSGSGSGSGTGTGTGTHSGRAAARTCSYSKADTEDIAQRPKEPKMSALGMGAEIEDLDKVGMGYLMLDSKAHKKVSDFKAKNERKEWTDRQLDPPLDNCNCVYLALVLAGVGFLLPYNSFIVAVDYFQTRYPGTTIIFDMNLVYIVMGFFAVLANNVLVETLSLHTRITFGYVVSFFTLLFVALCEIYWDWFSVSTSYTINLIAMAVLALGCTVQQSSFYGYTSMLPARYTQAVMAGESAAGFFVSMNRIITKLLLKDQQENTLIFFMLSIGMVGLCSGLHHTIRKSEFVKYYMMICHERKITLEPTEDVGLMDPSEGDSGSRNQYGVLKLQHSPRDAGMSGFSFANPVYEPSGAPPTLPVTAITTATVAPGSSGSAGPTYKVEDVVVRIQTGSSRPRPSQAFRGLRRGLEARWEVAQAVWPYMLCIAADYFVTQCLYPGIETEIVSCKYGSWMPVILIAVFNASDLLGKVMASVQYEWTRGHLLLMAGLRAFLVPLLLLCAYPRGRPAIPGEHYAMVLSMILGITNGLIGSIPMIQAPSRVPEEHRELTGNIMTLSYNIGLTGGSLMSYLLDSMLGPMVTNGCTMIPPIIGSTISTRTTTEIATTANTFVTMASTNATLISKLLLGTVSPVNNLTSTISVAATLATSAANSVTNLGANSATQSVTAVLSTTTQLITNLSQPGG